MRTRSSDDSGATGAPPPGVRAPGRRNVCSRPTGRRAGLARSPPLTRRWPRDRGRRCDGDGRQRTIPATSTSRTTTAARCGWSASMCRRRCARTRTCRASPSCAPRATRAGPLERPAPTPRTCACSHGRPAHSRSRPGASRQPSARSARRPYGTDNLLIGYPLAYQYPDLAPPRRRFRDGGRSRGDARTRLVRATTRSGPTTGTTACRR